MCIIKNQKKDLRVGKPLSDLAYPQERLLFNICVIIRLRQCLTIQKIPLIKMLTWITDCWRQTTNLCLICYDAANRNKGIIQDFNSYYNASKPYDNIITYFWIKYCTFYPTMVLFPIQISPWTTESCARLTLPLMKIAYPWSNLISFQSRIAERSLLLPRLYGITIHLHNFVLFSKKFFWLI